MILIAIADCRNQIVRDNKDKFSKDKFSKDNISRLDIIVEADKGKISQVFSN